MNARGATVPRSCGCRAMWMKRERRAENRVGGDGGMSVLPGMGSLVGLCGVSVAAEGAEPVVVGRRCFLGVG